MILTIGILYAKTKFLPLKNILSHILMKQKKHPKFTFIFTGCILKLKYLLKYSLLLDLFF